MTNCHLLVRPGAAASPGGSERGVALVIALMAMLLMTALGMALMLVSETETMIGANYRDSVEAQLRRRCRHRARDAGRAHRARLEQHPHVADDVRQA